MVRTFAHSIREFGWLNTIKHYVIELINKLTFFRIYRLMLIDQPKPEWLTLNPKYTCRFFNADEMRAYLTQEAIDLSEDFVNTAFAKGDLCCAILDDNSLISYGWYSNQATLINPHLRISCAAGYTYMYHGYTHPNYRGQRLHAIRVTHGLKEHSQKGANETNSTKGLIFYVEADNYRSLRSAARLNARNVGRVVTIRIFGKYLLHHCAGCQRYGLNITPV